MITSRVLLFLLPAACARAETGTATSIVVSQQGRDTVATAVIQPEGGTVEVEGIGRVTFPAGAFDVPRVVSVFTTSAPVTPEGRATWDVSVGAPEPLAYDVRVNTGEVAPATEFQVTLTVPDSYLNALPADYAPRVFAQVLSGGAMEDLDLYEVLDSDFDPVAKVVRALVPLHAVRPPGRAGTFEVIVVVGAVWR